MDLHKRTNSKTLAKIMNNKLIIKRMSLSELKESMKWVEEEGWNPGLYDGSCFYEADPNGFFLGLLENETVAMGSAVVYDEQFAFCGLYIVKPKYRGLGLGLQLTKERLNYVGNRITGIDGVVNNVSIYEKIGYKSAHKNNRYSFFIRQNLTFSPNLFPLKDYSFEQIVNYDQTCFPAKRNNFLRCWINQPFATALGYTENGKLFGYGVIRKCINGYKIGPLFSDSYLVAKSLLEGLCINKEGAVFIDIPENNLLAHRLVEEYHMKKTFEVMRMYRNGFPKIASDKIFGITTYELG